MTESGDVMAELRRQLKPYRGTMPTFDRLPEEGLDRDEVQHSSKASPTAKNTVGATGSPPGAVYHGDPDHVEFLNRVYALHSQSNPLHPDLWPTRDEVRGGDRRDDGGHARRRARGRGRPVVGTVTSGGTESILLAMKAYRDRARDAAASPSRRWWCRSPRTPRSTRRPSTSACSWCGSRWTATSRPTSRRWPRRDHRAHRRDRRLGAVLPARRHRPDRGARPSWRATAASASTPTPASAASSCRGPSGSATRCRRSTSGCPA